MAKEAKVTPNALRGFESGKRRTRAETTKRILAALNTTKDQLLAAPNALPDPRLTGLSVEDLNIARAFHDSLTPLRNGIIGFLNRRQDQAVATFVDRIHECAHRVLYDADALDYMARLCEHQASLPTPVETPTDVAAPTTPQFTIRTKTKA